MLKGSGQTLNLFFVFPETSPRLAYGSCRNHNKNPIYKPLVLQTQFATFCPCGNHKVLARLGMESTRKQSRAFGWFGGRRSLGALRQVGDMKAMLVGARLGARDV